MIALISPAKSLDFDTSAPTDEFTLPQFQEKTNYLVNKLKKLSAKKIGGMMNLSANLSQLNYERYQSFTPEYIPENSKQAIFTFSGDVYRGLDANTLTSENIEFIQKHLLILSGLYGFLRPLDRMQPYRLEMGTKWQITTKNKNLYLYWKETLTQKLNDKLNGQTIVNLASNEYAKAVDFGKIKSNVINFQFKDYKNGTYKSLMAYAKRARGLMARYMTENKIINPIDLQSFDTEGYYFDSKSSDSNNFIFLRD